MLLRSRIGRVALSGACLALVACTSPRVSPTQAIERSIHVGSPATAVWNTLTDEELQSTVWGGEWRFRSTWEAGAPVEFVLRDGAEFSRGRVLGSTPTQRLSYTWPDPEAPPGAEPESVTWTKSLLETGAALELGPAPQ